MKRTPFIRVVVGERWRSVAFRRCRPWHPPAAFSGGTVPDAHLIRTKQRQQSLGRYGGAGDQPVAFQLFRRRAVQERRKGCGTAYDDRCAGKGVRQIVAGVCQSVQYQLAAAQPEKDLKAVVRVPVPAAEQGADMEQRICGGSE